ncbi:conserved hypothetical protein [Leishmania braziliensis MHOM/BR/75/M2904]|uniref:Uncharacterized protein n=2 Tax=Leishmania braziliensis TaxID=5660 RepID=A4HL32_LEIBR|nr:conserved hypothetical protein [Leishmania braziliensis MHOM/BR/75/M2904]CAJ2479032.1 unnamed protein product [Leishmania braziliensis]CAM43213.1 conserved hypothetical protein [Leishmania braziliensis MHOM/BR/75/M2904]
MSEIEDLVRRLRSLTGYVVATPAPAPTSAIVAPAEKQVGEESLLILQQSLRRHPCFAVFHLSRAEVKCELLKQLEDAVKTPLAIGDDVPEAVTWRVFINNAAEKLEMERLHGVFKNARQRIHGAKDKLFCRLGIDDAPVLDQVGNGYACPWNVLTILENGILFGEGDFAEQEKTQLEVPNATASILQNTGRVYANTFDTMAWLHLLHQMMSFPVSSVRTVWHAALYHFPTAGPLVCTYARLEMAALAKKTRLVACCSETDTKDVYEGYLRLLNVFYRHLPLAFSCELYSLFFSFAAEYVQPDSASLDLLYRTCLRRDVGMLPQSTSLWVQYLNWRSASFRDHMRRREWRKRMYNRILAIPLVGLDAVKDEYDMFVATEYRGRLAPDERIELEKRLARVKTEADDLSRLMYFFYPTEWAPATSTHVQFPYTLYLARPLTIESPTASLSLRESVLSRIEMDLWSLWYTLLQRVHRPLFPGAGGEVLHYSRCRSFMTMMACFFPHQVTLWMELVDFCVYQQPLLSDKERFQSVAAAIDLAILFSQQDVCVRLFVAQVYHTDLGATEMAFREVKESLLQLHAWLLQYVRSDEERFTAKEALEKLQHITVLAVNYMRMGNTQEKPDHLRLVARFVMHHVEFLSLTMAALRKLLKSGAVETPAMFLHPFNLFCSHWILLELIRNRAARSALVILQQWCEHLKVMLFAGKNKGWSCEECGVDELVLDACANLLTADPSRGEEVEATLGELEDVARSDGLQSRNFLYASRQLRHRFFLPCRLLAQDDTSDIMLTAKLLLPHAAPHRYDTIQFSCPLPQRPLLLPGAETVTTPSLEDTTATQDAHRDEEQASLPTPAHSAHTFPEETLWSSVVGLRNFSAPARPRFDKTRRGPYPSRFYDRADGANKELPAVPTAPPSRLAIVSEAVQLPTLLDCLTSVRAGTAEESASDGKSATKLPPLEQLEEFIRQLPSVYEYNPDMEEDGQDVSTDWVLLALLSCESLS